MKRCTGPLDCVFCGMLCALAWIPRGVASARFTAEEAVQSEVVEETKVVEDDGMEAEEDGTEAVVENDDAEVDIADVLKDDVESLRYHQTNREDKFLINKTEMYDEDEIDDLTFRYEHSHIDFFSQVG